MVLFSSAFSSTISEYSIRYSKKYDIGNQGMPGYHIGNFPKFRTLNLVDYIYKFSGLNLGS